MDQRVSVILPEFVKEIITRIENAGFFAFAVGGCVRDTVMERTPDDYDISTSALPEEIAEIFPDIVPVGREFGTVGVKINKRIVEVTTFRKDGKYLGHRRPQDVRFSNDLIEDLARRDFTINAIAYNERSGIIDPFGGLSDINAHLVRAVGNPEERFEEDALRMLRAFRFAAKLGFEIEKGTLEAIYEKSHLTEYISAERIRDELIKTLNSDNPHYALSIVRAGLLDPYLLQKGTGIKANWIKKVPSGLASLCAFVKLLKENERISDDKAFLTSLRLDRASINLIVRACEIEFNVEDKIEIKKIMSRYGERAAKISAAVTGKPKIYDMIDEIAQSGEPYRLNQLSVNGDDLRQLGISGKELGQVLDFMLDEVIKNPENNNKKYLLSKFIK